MILFHTYPTNDAAPRQDDVGSAQVALSAHFEPLRWNFRKTMRYPKMQKLAAKESVAIKNQNLWELGRRGSIRMRVKKGEGAYAFVKQR